MFIESASRAQQPVQEAIDYCKNPKNNIQLLIIKSIDRFTRGGSSLYDHMKSQLSNQGVKLMDLYGVIGNQSVNTLEHLGVQYSWSVYNPTLKSELLEAERAKDEIRDIMSRMIGAEIQYTRLGYRVRYAPLGYQNERIETDHGKRLILAPHPEESVWIRRMFEWKIQGNFGDKDIIDKVNLLGFRTRKHYFRDARNKNKITGVKGGNKLEIKYFDRILKNPIYAGVTVERWTNNKPVKCKFPGLVSIEEFNKANKGKVMLVFEEGELKFFKGKVLRKRLVTTARSLSYPYKQLVLCPYCRHNLYGSASRGRLGTHYPAYHCSKDHKHYFRVRVPVFDQTIITFLGQVRIKKEFIKSVQEKIIRDYKQNKDDSITDRLTIEQRIQQINAYIRLLLDKIKVVHTEAAIRSLEEDLEKAEQEKNDLLSAKLKIKSQKSELKEDKEACLEADNKLPQPFIEDPVKRVRLFSQLFVQTPTYTEILEKTAVLKPEFELTKAS